jgi:hypothetical protein
MSGDNFPTCESMEAIGKFCGEKENTKKFPKSLTDIKSSPLVSTCVRN